MTDTDLNTFVDIADYKYEINKLGDVRYKGKTKCLKIINANGYSVVNLSCSFQGKRRVKRFYVTQLMFNAFMPNQDRNVHIKHIDKNKFNNSLSNLYIV